MNDWCFSIHSNNFLLKESRDSTLSLAEAEKQIIKFFNNWSFLAITMCTRTGAIPLRSASACTKLI